MRRILALPRRWLAVVGLIAALVLAGAATSVVNAVTSSEPAGKQARAAAVRDAPAAGTGKDAAALRQERGGADGLQDPILEADEPQPTGTPVRIRIPAIAVDAGLQQLHRDEKGVLQPPDSWTQAGWYAEGVVPGAVGPAVIAGHLDTVKRVAVFVNLRLLRPGDRITVRMSTKRSEHFVVTHSRVVRKALFPTAEVYGPTPDAQLRLITCSEPFDEAQGIYADNLVVFATKA